ncbi:putative Rhs element Vgr protein [Candidatus Zixiibacteriota bacterium]|nr:putative Rhs element Vgr protein [candidate division Zixibacteria bacterium]
MEIQGKAGSKERAELETAAICTVRIDNKEIKQTLSSIQLDQYIDRHHMLQVRIKQVGTAQSGQDFDDPADYTAFLGKSISLNVKPTGGMVDSSRELEFIGIVTQVSLDNSIDGLNTVLITSHSPTIGLDNSKKNAFFFDQSASDIIGSTLRNHPITLGNVDSSKGVSKFTVQYRESDYDFVRRLAFHYGKFAFYDGKEFCVVKASGSGAEELTWRETLGSFSFGLGTADPEFTSSAYNYEQSKIFTQDSKSLPAQSSLPAMLKTSPDASKNIFKNSGFTVSSRFIPDAQSLDEILQVEKNGSLGKMIQCQGYSIVPKVAVGHSVKIKGMSKLDGTFWVNSVRHIFNESGKYHNTFICTPVDTAFPSTRFNLQPFTDLQSAVVVDNDDPEKLGRIKVKFPWIQDSTIWVRYLSFNASQTGGWYSLPEIDDIVLVGFEMGNPEMPVALGSLYDKNNPPDSKAVDSKNDIRQFLTKGGSLIQIKDTSGSEEIKISMKDGKNSIVMQTSGPSITIESQNGDISIKGKSVTINSDQNIEIKAGGDLKAEGSANLKLKGGMQSDLEGNMVNVKGSMIKLN